MVKFLFPLVAFIALISLTLNVRFILEKQSARFKVVEVIDGDTFKIDSEGGRRVRLLGVDAPELGRCLADQGKELLARRVLGKEVTLSDQFTDPYGRIIANVFVGGDYINVLLVAAGLARPDYTANPRREELTAAYAQARTEKKGIASGVCQATSPPDGKCRVKGNVDDDTQKKVYYLPSCKSYAQVIVDSSKADSWFCSEKEASAAGFTLSSGCP